ncbi:MAG TPA: hypothetical protein PK124_00390 [Bacteroidales bacterium]|jgi:hypothetical protein|nr:MAG: hypothetical protein BWX59_00061 [Bacteroidetes bacterium ADurb.Bin028]HOR59687.1 hypothetical protein [Bacteroidales bacterium]
MRKSQVENAEIPLKERIFRYALIKVSYAKSSASIESPKVRFSKNLRTGD